MARLARLALLASVTLTLSSPAPVISGEAVELEKRTTYTGRGTWYDPGLGNCNVVNFSNDLVLAISKGLYNSNGGGSCGQWVNIVYKGIQAYALIEGSCQSCGVNDIEMSPTLFEKFAPFDGGAIEVTWNFMPQGWQPQ